MWSDLLYDGQPNVCQCVDKSAVTGSSLLLCACIDQTNLKNCFEPQEAFIFISVSKIQNLISHGCVKLGFKVFIS